MLLLSSCDFLIKITFSSFSFENTIRMSNSLNPYQNRLPVLIWVETVCKSSQQTTSKELTFIILARPDDISSRTLAFRALRYGT